MAAEGHVRIGDYEIHEQLGRGGMGVVYRAREVTLDRFVALKVLNPSAASDPTEMARFEKEARTTSALNHPHIVQVFDLGSADHEGQTVHYIAMELVEGRSLREMLEGSSPLDEILDILAQVADALDKTHANGIVHRDVKPENILVTEDGYAKIVDFGIAKLTGSSELRARSLDASGEDPTKTQAGEVMGTLAYMAPEQIRGRDVDARTDVFALGNILHEAVMGVAPFRRESAPKTLRSILNDDPPEMRDPKRPAPTSLERIARRCLARDASDRYDSTAEVAELLRAVREEMHGDVTEWLPVERLAAGRVAVAVGLVTILLVIAILFILSRL